MAKQLDAAFFDMQAQKFFFKGNFVFESDWMDEYRIQELNATLFQERFLWQDSRQCNDEFYNNLLNFTGREEFKQWRLQFPPELLSVKKAPTKTGLIIAVVMFASVLICFLIGGVVLLWLKDRKKSKKKNQRMEHISAEEAKSEDKFTNGGTTGDSTK